jgi:uncharacterized RDD family membrane protein YckC
MNLGSASHETAETAPVAGFRYAGFWIRVWASFIDLVLFSLWTLPLMYLVYGPALWTNQQLIMGPADVLINWVLPSIAVILFWKKRQATVGKMAIRARIVDARTGQAPTTRQDLIRYFGYLLSVMPLGLGYLWVAFDSRKQGFHDKLAGTVVVRDART